MTAASVAKAVAYVDGASRGNPGPAAAGVVLQDPKGKLIGTLSIPLGRATNNTAEYLALIFALQEAMLIGVRSLQVYTDSELLARQFSGQYKVKDESLKILSLLVRQLKRGFKDLTVTHVPREQNTLADREANRALDGDGLFGTAL